MTSRGRYLPTAEFCRLLGDLHITENVFQSRLLEFLEEQRLVVPATRVRWPEDLVIEGREGIPKTKSPHQVRETAQALGNALQRYGGFIIDPEIEHPLDEASEGPLVTHRVADTPFQPWETFKTEINPPDREPHFVDDAVDTYYHDWQALLVADAVNMGVHFLIDTTADKARQAGSPGMGRCSWPASI